MHRDPTSIVAEDGDDEIDVDIVDAAHTCPLPPSLHAMMETIMTTQAAHGQLLHGLLAEVGAMRADLAHYTRPVPHSIFCYFSGNLKNMVSVESNLIY